MSASIVFRRQEDIALVDMVAGRALILDQLPLVHQTGHTRRLKSSQYRVHHHQWSFVCS